MSDRVEPSGGCVGSVSDPVSSPVMAVLCQCGTLCVSPVVACSVGK